MYCRDSTLFSKIVLVRYDVGKKFTFERFIIFTMKLATYNIKFKDRKAVIDRKLCNYNA